MSKHSFSRISEQAVFALLMFSILWRGGKSLEATWLLALIACAMAVWYGLCKLILTRNERKDPLFHAELPWHFSVLVLGFTVWTMLSFATSTTQNYGLDEVLRTASFAFIFFWTMRVASDSQRRISFIDRFAMTLSTVAMLACVVGIAVYVLQPVSRFVGTFFDWRFTTDYWPNAWAEFLLLAWPMVLITKEVHMCGRWRLSRRSAVLALLLASLFLSYSRGALIALGLQLLLLSILTFRSKYVRVAMLQKRTALRACTILVTAAMLFVGVNAIRSRYHVVQSVSQKITFTSAEGTSSINERNSFWHQAFVLSFDHPVLGYGPYSFRFVQPRRATSVLATSDHPHNVFLKTAMELGWPALVLLLLFLAAVLKPAFRQLRQYRDHPDTSITTMLLVGVFGLLAHNMIDYNLQFVAIGLPFWILLGLVASTGLQTQAITGHSFHSWNRLRILLKIEVFLAALMLLVTLFEGSQLFLSSLGRHAENRGDAAAALRWYRSAASETFSRDMHLSEAQLFANVGDLPAALDAVHAYIKKNAEDARGWTLLGSLELRGNRPQNALTALSHAYDLGKYTDLGILELLLKTASMTPSASALVARKLEFDELFSAYGDAIEQNTHFIDLSTNPEHLMAVSRQLSRLFPLDADRYQRIARKAYAHAEEVRKEQNAKRMGMLW